MHIDGTEFTLLKNIDLLKLSAFVKKNMSCKKNSVKVCTYILHIPAAGFYILLIWHGYIANQFSSTDTKCLPLNK